MKTTKSATRLSICVALLAIVIGVTGQTPRSHSDPIESVLHNQLTQKIAGVDVLFESDGEATKIRLGNGLELASVAHPLFVDSFIVSRNRNFAALKISKLSKDERGAYYSAIYIISKQNDKVALRALFKQESFPRGQWVIELGAISDDGFNILMKIGNGSVPFMWNNRLVSDHEWQTWDTESEKMLRRGIDVPSRG